MVSLINAATLIGRSYKHISMQQLNIPMYTHPLLENTLQHRHDVVSLHAINIESLGPALQPTMVNVVLCRRVREGKPQRQSGQVLVMVMGIQELLQTIGNILPQLL